MLGPYYPAWNHTRAKAIIDHYNHNWFKGKRILDLGSGNGDFAAAFARLGSEVLCVEIRDENINALIKNHVYLKRMKLDLDAEFPFAGQQFDMVFSLGLLCHLKNYEKHISDICSVGEHIVLETEVLDSNDPFARVGVFEDKGVSDFSFSGEGSILSAANIEKRLSDLGATYKRSDNFKINSGPFIYDWKEINSGRKQGNRRLWFIKRDKYLQQMQMNNIATDKAFQQAQPPPNQNISTINFNAGNNIDNIIFSPSQADAKKIKLYIITYNSTDHLNENLTSLFNSDLMNYNHEINIINNHSNFFLADKFRGKVNVLHNQTRPDFSTGHLSRNWNQCIINGFRDLNNPHCEILITCQVDTVFEKLFCSKLLNHHNRYTFIQAGLGDNMCSYKADAIKKIGLWDERFCNIGFQEADFFMRALMYNKHNSSINDRGHGRVLNPIPDILIHHPVHNKDERDAHAKSAQYHTISLAVFEKKYGMGYGAAEGWKQSVIDNPPKHTLIDNFVYYPFFEKDVEDLFGKKYIWSDKRKYL